MNHMPGRILLYLILSLQLISCASVQPFVSADSVGHTNHQEKRLWELSDEFDKDVAFSERIYDDNDLHAYLQGIVNRLYPEFEGKIAVHVIKSPALNAFALPNGSIYINTSLIARFDNEAQAATVLGHESAHFVERHSLEQIQNAKFSTAFANALTLAGIPLVGPVLAVSSISGYSQILESDADEVAFRQMAMVGYDTSEAIKFFEKMAAETEALDQDEPFFFSTHPRMVERVESFKKMQKKSGATGSFKGADNHLVLTMPLRISSLEEDLAMDRFKSVLLALEENRESTYPEYTKFHLGEAYRLRGDDGDLIRALNLYNEAILKAPDYAPSYRALGYHYYKAKDIDKAQTYFERYLELAPEANDRDYVLYYIDQIRDRSKE